jgi:hypothetical protein
MMVKTRDIIREKSLRIKKVSKPFTNQPIPLEGVGGEKLPRNLVPIYKES